jgi:hypothetical protein
MVAGQIETNAPAVIIRGSNAPRAGTSARYMLIGNAYLAGPTDITLTAQSGGKVLSSMFRSVFRLQMRRPLEFTTWAVYQGDTLTSANGADCIIYGVIWDRRLELGRGPTTLGLALSPRIAVVYVDGGLAKSVLKACEDVDVAVEQGLSFSPSTDPTDAFYLNVKRSTDKFPFLELSWDPSEVSNRLLEKAIMNTTQVIDEALPRVQPPTVPIVELILKFKTVSNSLISNFKW